MIENKLVNIKELAEILNVSTRHIFRLKQKNTIPYIQIGDSIRFIVEDVVSSCRK